MRKFFTLFLLTTGFALAGCNTIEGMGEDVQSVGEKVEDAAD